MTHVFLKLTQFVYTQNVEKNVERSDPLMIKEANTEKLVHWQIVITFFDQCECTVYYCMYIVHSTFAVRCWEFSTFGKT